MKKGKLSIKGVSGIDKIKIRLNKIYLFLLLFQAIHYYKTTN